MSPGEWCRDNSQSRFVQFVFAPARIFNVRFGKNQSYVKRRKSEGMVIFALVLEKTRLKLQILMIVLVPGGRSQRFVRVQ